MQREVGATLGMVGAAPTLKNRIKDTDYDYEFIPRAIAVDPRTEYQYKASGFSGKILSENQHSSYHHLERSGSLYTEGNYIPEPGNVLEMSEYYVAKKFTSRVRCSYQKQETSPRLNFTSWGLDILNHKRDPIVPAPASFPLQRPTDQPIFCSGKRFRARPSYPSTLRYGSIINELSAHTDDFIDASHDVCTAAFVANQRLVKDSVLTYQKAKPKTKALKRGLSFRGRHVFEKRQEQLAKERLEQVQSVQLKSAPAQAANQKPPVVVEVFKSKLEPKRTVTPTAVSPILKNAPVQTATEKVTVVTVEIIKPVEPQNGVIPTLVEKKSPVIKTSPTKESPASPSVKTSTLIAEPSQAIIIPKLTPKLQALESNTVALDALFPIPSTISQKNGLVPSPKLPEIENADSPEITTEAIMQEKRELFEIWGMSDQVSSLPSPAILPELPGKDVATKLEGDKSPTLSSPSVSSSPTQPVKKPMSLVEKLKHNSSPKPNVLTMDNKALAEQPNSAVFDKSSAPAVPTGPGGRLFDRLKKKSQDSLTSKEESSSKKIENQSRSSINSTKSTTKTSPMTSTSQNRFEYGRLLETKFQSQWHTEVDQASSTFKESPQLSGSSGYSAHSYDSSTNAVKSTTSLVVEPTLSITQNAFIPSPIASKHDIAMNDIQNEPIVKSISSGLNHYKVQQDSSPSSLCTSKHDFAHNAKEIDNSVTSIKGHLSIVAPESPGDLSDIKTEGNTKASSAFSIQSASPSINKSTSLEAPPLNIKTSASSVATPEYSGDGVESSLPSQIHSSFADQGAMLDYMLNVGSRQASFDEIHDQSGVDDIESKEDDQTEDLGAPIHTEKSVSSLTKDNVDFIEIIETPIPHPKQLEAQYQIKEGFESESSDAEISISEQGVDVMPTIIETSRTQLGDDHNPLPKSSMKIEDSDKHRSNEVITTPLTDATGVAELVIPMASSLSESNLKLEESKVDSLIRDIKSVDKHLSYIYSKSPPSPIKTSSPTQEKRSTLWNAKEDYRKSFGSDYSIDDFSDNCRPMSVGPSFDNLSFPDVDLEKAISVSYKGVACDVYVRDFELYCVEQTKKKPSAKFFFPMELRRVLKIQTTDKKAIIFCCVIRKGKKDGSKLKRISFKMNEDPLPWAKSLRRLAIGDHPFIPRKVLVLTDKFDKEGRKLVEKYMLPVWDIVAVEVVIKEVQMSEFSVTTALSDIRFDELSNLLILSSDYISEAMQILVRKRYVSTPSFLPCEADPVSAAHGIVRSCFGASNQFAFHVSGVRLKRSEGGFQGFFKSFQ